MDINKVYLSGLAVSQPILTKLSSATPVAVFSLQINERFLDRSGAPKVKPNVIKVESLGRSAEAVMNKVRQGQRYAVDGYLRQDGDDIKIRTFAVYKEESQDSVVYNDGLKQALQVLKKSRDLTSAISSLEELLNHK